MAAPMMTSVRAVDHNLGAMLLWAVLLVVLMAVGFATVFLPPLVSPARWHAYRDLVE